jgi:hypothetical protein
LAKAAAALDALGKRLSPDELHHQEVGAFVLLEVEKRGDIGMVQGGEETGFPFANTPGPTWDKFSTDIVTYGNTYQGPRRVIT